MEIKRRLLLSQIYKTKRALVIKLDYTQIWDHLYIPKAKYNTPGIPVRITGFYRKGNISHLIMCTLFKKP